MENTAYRTCDSSALKILLIVVLVGLIIWMLYPFFHHSSHKSSESFKPTLKQNIRVVSNMPSDYQQKEPPMIEPPSYDADTATIQSGSGFIPQKQYFTPWGSMIQVGDMSTADGTLPYSETSITDYSMNFNQCSPACCSDQWPVPFKLPVDKSLCGSKDEFVPNSYYCNNGWQDSGCLCMTKQQSEFLQTRGDNTDYYY